MGRLVTHAPIAKKFEGYVDKESRGRYTPLN